MTIQQIISRTRELVNEKAAAQRIGGVSPGTLGVWRSTGRYNLPFIKVGRLVRHDVAELDAWIERRTRETGATA